MHIKSILRIFFKILNVGAGICLLQYVELKRFRTTSYHIESNKLKSNMKILCLADLHSRQFGPQNKRLLHAIEQQNPELIVIAGDMITTKDGIQCQDTILFLKKLAEKYPVYYANGNHEYYLKQYVKTYGTAYEQYKKQLEESGVIFLENTQMDVDIAGNKITLSGLEIEKKFYDKFKKTEMKDTYLESMLGKSKESNFQVLLAHNPIYFDQYATWGADLTFSGHMHGGLISIPKIGSLLSPQFHWFPKYDAGLYQKGAQYLALSRGLGTHTFHIRIFNRAEIVVVHLKANSLEKK